MDHETAMKGSILLNRMERNYEEWNEIKRTTGLTTIVEKFSKKDLFNFISDQSEYNFLQYENTIPDVIAQGVKYYPMTTKDFQETIDFFSFYFFHGQMA